MGFLMKFISPPVRSKVPRITALFWVVKLLSTALGEATSDYLVHRFNPYLAVIGGFAFFGLALVLQLRSRAYNAPIYWFAVVMVAVFGTMAADVLHIQFGVPYIASSMVFAGALSAVFTLWYRVEGTLSIHSIVTTRRELFYWSAVLATFAMGTAVGDLAAYTAHLGFLTAGVVFVVAFASPGFAFRFFRADAIAMFWVAYVITRPLGASFADWFGKSVRAHGLGYGDGPVSGVLTALIIGLVAYFALTRADADDGEAVGQARGLHPAEESAV